MLLAASQLVKVQGPAAEAGEDQQAVAGAVPRLLVVQAGLKDWGSSGLESPPSQLSEENCLPFSLRCQDVAAVCNG